MSEVKLPKGGSTITYSTREEVQKDLGNSDRDLLLKLYEIGEHISTLLQVRCPDITIANMITELNEHDGSLSIMLGKHYSPADIPELENDLILLALPSWQLSERVIGVLAHEIRHIFQDQFDSRIKETLAQGYRESLYNPAEIDADGFAIWYLYKFYGMHIEKAGSLLCPKEKKYEIKAYIKRIDSAKEFEAEFLKKEEEYRVSIDHENSNILSFFKRLFKKYKSRKRNI